MREQDLYIWWAKQPSAGPITQYLRDIEREVSIALLAPPSKARILDFGSEFHTTRRLYNRCTLTRADFSLQAQEIFIRQFGEKINYVNTLEKYQLDITNLHPFDSIISIGPFDFADLPLNECAVQLYNLLAPGGKLVITLPTTNSYYYKPRHTKIRWLSLDEISQLCTKLSTQGARTKLYSLFQPKGVLFYNRITNNRFIPLWIGRMLVSPFWLLTLLMNLVPLERWIGYKILLIQKPQ